MNQDPSAPPETSVDRGSPWTANAPRRRHTLGVTGAMLILAIWVLVSGSGLASHFLTMPTQLAFLNAASIPQVLATVGLLAAILIFGWRDTALGAATANTGKLMWFPSLYLLGFAGIIVAQGSASFPVLAGLLYTMFWIAASEELMFRGLLFPALRRKFRLWPAIALTCGFFGAVHLLNALGTGDVVGAVIQTVAATMTGLLLLALRLRRGSLWPAIWYHMAWNIGVLGIGMTPKPEGQSAIEAVTKITQYTPLTVAALFLMVLPNALYAFWLLRHSGTQRLPGDIQLDGADR